MNTERNELLPFRQLNPTELLGANTHYVIPQGQIIFYFEEWNEFVITSITDQEVYTVEIFDLLPESAPYQLINGKLVFMPAPTPLHQRISRKLTMKLSGYVEDNKLGEVFYSPIDVELDKQNVLQPDLIFISIKRSSIIQQRIFGAPEFIVEILSSNEKYDREDKKALYGKHGVEEYWIVHPTDRYIEVYHNIDKELQLVQKAEGKTEVVSKSIDGFVLQLSDIFDFELTK